MAAAGRKASSKAGKKKNVREVMHGHRDQGRTIMVGNVTRRYPNKPR